MRTTNVVKLNLPSLPEEAKTAHRLPGLTNNLISAPILCDAGCEIIFSKKKVSVKKDDKLIMEGWRDPLNRLWRVPLDTTPSRTETNNYFAPLTSEPNLAQALYECESEKELIHFYHAICFSPTKSTWTTAIRKGFFRG